MTLNEAQVLDVSSQREFSERQDLGKKRIHLETHSTDGVQTASEGENGPKIWRG